MNEAKRTRENIATSLLIMQVHVQPVDPKLDDKAKKWRQMNSKKYSDQKKFGFAQLQKENMPPEHLRSWL